MGFFILYIVFSLFTGVFCSQIAKQKGYGAFRWFMAGLLFSFLALVSILGMPDLKLRKYIKQIAEK